MEDMSEKCLTVNELFSGIGTQAFALEYLGIPHKVVGMAEIEKNAIEAYNILHGETRNYGDISKIEKLDYADLWTYSFPCQDLSSAGKGKGIDATDEEGNKVATRSGLLWEVERLLAKSCGYDIEQGLLVKNDKYEINPPKYLVLENVPELIERKKHSVHFDKWLNRLEELGYTTSYGLLNGANFGVPQNRNRVFCLSVRKDIYDNIIEFPDENAFYCTPVRVGFENFVDKEVREYNGPLMIDPKMGKYLLPAFNRDIESIASCSANPLNNIEIWTCECKSGFQDHRVGIKWAPTIRHQNTHTAIFFNNQIHKLTACECWKFMGIKEKDFWKVKNNSEISDNILCGLAGNAIVVPVLMSLFNQIWLIETKGCPYGKSTENGMEVPFCSVDVNEK